MALVEVSIADGMLGSINDTGLSATKTCVYELYVARLPRCVTAVSGLKLGLLEPSDFVHS